MEIPGIIYKLNYLMWIVWEHVLKHTHSNDVYLIASNLSGEELQDIRNRLNFYRPDFNLIVSKNKLKALLSLKPVLYFDKLPPQIYAICTLLVKRIYFINSNYNPDEGMAWINLLNYRAYDPAIIQESRLKFCQYLQKLKLEKYDKSYLFGTGPTLEKAINFDYSDGYRIVCNTIVRDKEIWEHLNPHFIVAADPIHHFGHTRYAVAFRNDLHQRLKESNAYFVYPLRFHPVIIREFKDFSDRLLPIPVGHIKKYHYGINNHYVLRPGGNILPIILLPLGFTLSHNVYLWGFDGRAPDAKLFWQHSPKHNYGEYMSDLINAHPEFYHSSVPEDDPTKYFKKYFGDEMEYWLTQAEVAGCTIHMMHKSWTPCLQKRYDESFS